MIKHLFKWVSRTGWLVGLLGFLTAFVWSLMIPPFHVPDETAHFAYVQYFAETGTLPRKDAGRPSLSSEETATLDALWFNSVAGNREAHPLWNEQQEKALRDAEKRPLDRDNAGGFTPAINNPPLYYLAESVPYWLSPDSSVVGRLQAMRFLSALFAGLTAMFIFLFLRELLPRSSRGWVVGSVACALAPEFIFISSGLNNDALLFTFSAAMFFAIAYAFKNGFTLRVACGIGAIAGLGLMTKFTFAGLFAGVALAVLVLAYRSRVSTKEKLMRVGGAAVAAAIPTGIVYLLCATVWNRPLLDVSTSPAAGAPKSSLTEMISYVWQLYLPKLPMMSPQFKTSPIYDLWFSGFVGRFGWVDYAFDDTWVQIGQWFVIALAVSALVALVKSYDSILRGRVWEWLSYLGMAAGTAFFVGAAGYQSHKIGLAFEQPRYLLGLLALWGAFLAISSRAGGRKSSQLVGAAIVMAAIGHNLFALLLTLERYYA